MKDGILNINKPQGVTSHDVVRDIRRLLGIKKIGHTGTLDPMATGVLPVCIGKATRITEYTDLDFKKYRCTLRLGQVTDTQDIWGEILEENSTAGITPDDVREAFSGFHGKISQKPPMYSAVRVGGRRLYDYARAGETVEVKEREVYIRGLIEFTNYCRNNCYYCGIRRDNKKAQRYRLSEEEIRACCEEGYRLGFRTFVLQGGEDPYYTDALICDIVSKIRNRFEDCAITLSLGEKSKEI